MARAKTLQAGDIVNIYKQIASYPGITSATFANSNTNDDFISIRAVWNQKDIDRKEKTIFVKSYVVDSKNKAVLSASLPQEINNQLWDVESSSGKYRAVVRKQKDKKGEDKQYLEIWSTRQKFKTIDVSALGKHGDIVGDDGQFGSVMWSRSECHLLYVAEKKKPKTSSFFDSNSASEGDVVKTEETKKGEENLYCESWGEQLVERHATVICIMDVEASTISLLENVPDDISPGQAVWAPDDAGVVFVGWCHEPFRLGLKFCVQRKSTLYYLDFQKGPLESLSKPNRAVRYPYFSPDDKRLIYLDSSEGGPHNMCSRLMLCNWEMRESETVVALDTVNTPSEGEFPGIYTWALAPRIWLSDNVHIVMSTFWRSHTAVVVINVDNGIVTRLQPENEASVSLLDVQDNRVLLVCSSPVQPFYLLYGTLELSDLNSTCWLKIDAGNDSIENIQWRILKHVPTAERENPKYRNLDFESILLLPKMSDVTYKPPLILFPHGGPHSGFDTSFSLIPAIFAQCGFAVLLVNFRGSLGFGQDNILSLLGCIGDQDVKDCKSAADEVISQGLVDGSKMLIFGGSHGGFLTAHLVGQYPASFKAASARNPVVNLTSMVGTTDIQDWVFTEAGESFAYDSMVDSNLLTKLWSASPIRYVNEVKTPFMLLVGLQDKRVPPSQSIEYYKALKARGVPVRCHTYPNSNHSLSEVEVEADSIVNTLLWFAQHL